MPKFTQVHLVFAVLPELCDQQNSSDTFSFPQVPSPQTKTFEIADATPLYMLLTPVIISFDHMLM